MAWAAMARAGSAAMQGARRALPLNDFADATATRASGADAYAGDPRNGWAPYDLVAPWKGTDVARILPDGAILIEPARVQYVGRTDLSAWTRAGTPEVTATTGLDGLESAWTLTDDSGAATEAVYRATAALGVTGTYCASYFVKKDNDETRFPEFQHNQGAGGSAHFQVNTKTGATTVRVSSTWTGVSVSTHDCGEWWRVFLVFTTASTAAITISIFPAVGTVWNAVSATATGAVTVWNPQLELGAFPTSPIRNTTGAVVTRQKDLVSHADGTFDPAFQHGFSFDVWFLFDSTAIVSAFYTVSKDVNEPLIRWSGPTTMKFNSPGGSEITFGGLAYSFAQKLTFRVDDVANTVTVSGATAGNATLSFGAGEWDGSGVIEFNQNAGTVTAGCVISRLRRVN